MTKKHKHSWELVCTQIQFPNNGIISKEYAYLICKECGAVKKVEVKEEYYHKKIKKNYEKRTMARIY